MAEEEDDPNSKTSSRDLSFKNSNSIGNRDELRIASMAEDDDPKLNTSKPSIDFDFLLNDDPFPGLSDFNSFDDWFAANFPTLEDHIAKNSTEVRKKKEMETKGSDEVKTCSASNKKREVFPPPKRNQYRKHQLYPIQYELIYRHENHQEPLVSYFGRNQLNQPMGGFVPLSEFEQVVQQQYFA